MNEFDAIARYFKPLSDGAEEALDLEDDAALLGVGGGLVVSVDTIVAGVHFRQDDPLDSVGWKALAVNVSDLVAKGARPWRHLLALSLPPGFETEGLTAFARGLGDAQRAYGSVLLGGDTTRTPGPLTISITAIGRLDAGAIIRRRTGLESLLDVWVTGTIGAAALGLDLLDGRLASHDAASSETWIDAYRRPRPPLAWLDAHRRFAAAAADVSDGLIADLGHIAKASGREAVIELDQLPFNPATEAWLLEQGDEIGARVRLATAGDDYQTVFLADPKAAEAIEAEARARDVRLTRIGRSHRADGAGAVIARFKGRTIEIARAGFTHF